MFKKSSCFFQSILGRVSPSLCSQECISDNLLGALLILKVLLALTDGLVIFLDGLLGFNIGSIGMLKGSLKLGDVSLKLLLHPDGLSLALALLFKSGLHAVNCLLEVLTSAHKLFFLLCNPPFDFLPNLSEFKLSPENLVLLLFKSSFGFLKSSLELHLLSFQTFPNFVNFMDRSASLANLIHDILDLIAQALIFLPDLIQLKDRLIIGRLDSEKF